MNRAPIRKGVGRKVARSVAAMLLVGSLTLSAGSLAHAAYPGANGALYFSTGRPRPLDIWWTHPVLGMGPMPAAVNSPSDDWAHYWSPDGSQMLFQSRRDGDLEIYLWDSATASVKQLTHNKVEDAYASWSPPMADGKLRIVFERRTKNNLDLWVMNIDGSGQKLLFATKKDDHHAAWSPLGDEIAFASVVDGDSDVYLLDVALNNGVVSAVGPARNLTNNSRGSEYGADWAPTGNQLVYTRQADSPLPRTGYNENIWRMDADGSGQTLLIDHQFYDAQAEWSPDGTTIAFASGTQEGDATWDIWTMDVNGDGLTQITDDEFPDFQPEWRNVPPA